VCSSDLSSMRALLETMGHTVTSSWNGEAALALLAETGLEPDLVILDMNMPGLGGSGTLPRLRALKPTVPVLLATGRADQRALDLAGSHPFVTLLAKPFGLQELREKLAASRAAPPDLAPPGCAFPGDNRCCT
jgi:CheY-like chemotaxis protein